uniref:Uncharacterized protein n=1 Tax=Anguilla anguilla TaxID=7936 RepID=A0A0E9URW8_ANGAN
MNIGATPLASAFFNHHASASPKQMKTKCSCPVETIMASVVLTA